MSQAAFLSRFDAMAATAFLGAGLADRATYLSLAAQDALAAYAEALAAYEDALAAYDPAAPDAGPAPVPPSADGLPAPVPCVVLVDRDVQQFTDGDMAAVSAPATVVTFLGGAVSPDTGGLVQVEGDSVALRLVRRIRADESRSVWEVEHA